MYACLAGEIVSLVCIVPLLRSITH
jgi:hypothetical protein